MAISRKNEVFALPSIAAAVLGASVFSVSVFECMFAEEKETILPSGGSVEEALKD